MSASADNWIYKEIRDVLSPLADGNILHQGWSPRCEQEASEKDTDWAALKTTAIQDGSFDDSFNKRLPDTLAPRPNLEVRPGDILITCAGPRVRCGVACLVTKTRPRLMISGKMYRFRAKESVVAPEFLVAYLRSPEGQAAIDRMKTGGSESGLNLTHDRFFQLRVPVAPLDHQRRIAAKLDGLFKFSKNARAELARIPRLVERYKKAILGAAFRGELTAGWRKQHSDSSPIGCGSKHHQSAIGDFFEPPYAIPGTWRWLALSKLGLLDRGRSRHRPRNAPELYGGPYPFIQTGDIRAAGGRVVTFEQTYSEAGLAQSRLWPKGTVCITIAANIAETAILGIDACFPDSIVGFQANPERCEPHFIEFFIRTVKEELEAFAPATAQKNINLETLRIVNVPCPPLNEQREIIQRIETLFRRVDQVIAEESRAAELLDRLERTTLSKAFRGELFEKAA